MGVEFVDEVSVFCTVLQGKCADRSRVLVKCMNLHGNNREGSDAKLSCFDTAHLECIFL